MQGTSKSMEMLSELTADPTIAAQLKAGTLNVQMIMGLWAMKQQQQQQQQLDQTATVPFGLRSPILPPIVPAAAPSPVAAIATHPHTTEDGGALDLSAGRRDSYETMRKTPSPYNGSSFSDMSPSSGSATSSSAPSGQYQTQSAHQLHHQLQHQYPSPIESLHESKPMLTVYAPHIDINTMPTVLHGLPAYANTSPMSGAAATSSAVPALSSGGSHPISPYIMQRMAEAHHQQQQHEQQRIAAAAATIAPIPTITAPTTTSTTTAAADLKPTRPFKTYPRDPLSIAATFSATDALHGGDSPIKYVAFRKRMLDQIHESLGGHQTVSNPKMRRTKGPEQRTPCGDSPPSGGRNSRESAAAAAAAAADERLAEESATGSDGGASDTNTSCSAGNGGNVKDAAYYERRQKNNAAAKKSRDRRRIKEDEITIRNAFLEKEVTHLRYENEAMKLQMMQHNLTPIFK